jgi:hypothetical protein
MGSGALIQLVPDAPINLANAMEITLDDRNGLTWEDGHSNGGNSIIDYQVWYDQGSDDFIILASNIVEREYTATSLYSGVTYKFKVKARNSVGYGDLSQEIAILAAQIPDIPNAPTTTISDRWNVVIDWTAPYNGGTPITSYTIEIRTTDAQVYAIDSTDCNGADSTIMAETQCTVLVSTLRAAPFSLTWGASVYAKITATNYLGDSIVSLVGNGAIILTFPDEPINLENNLEVTWGTTIGLTWDEGFENGGTPVLDYTVFSLASDSSEYIEEQVGVVGTSVTLHDFNPGITYTFKVKSRNVFDFSVGYSNEISILAASTPAKPNPPTTTIDGANVKIEWQVPNNMGY